MTQALWTILRIYGPDAADFLHRLSSAQVHALSVKGTVFGFFLQPNGKIYSPFILERTETETFLLHFQDQSEKKETQRIQAWIEQFTFAEQIQIEIIQAPTPFVPVSGPTAEQLLLQAPTLLKQGHRLLSLPAALCPETPTLWITQPGTKVIPAHTEIFEWQRIQKLIPNWSHELLPEFNPLEIGAAFGIADQKGCYPGQEVIEKIISLGSPARRLVLLQGEGNGMAEQSPLYDSSGQSVGAVTSFSCMENRWCALAWTKKRFAQEGTPLFYSEVGPGNPPTGKKSVLVSAVAPYRIDSID